MLRNIYCVSCGGNMPSRLTNGREIYPHRKDLENLPFWICDICKNYVGCHHKNGGNVPLGVIPTPELRSIRSQIHLAIDPIWKSGKMTRSKLYKLLGNILGYEFHTAGISDVLKARQILILVQSIKSLSVWEGGCP